MNVGYACKCLRAALLCCCWAAAAATPAVAEQDKAEITVLYDAFGKTSTMKKDWGFSAFIEYGGKRILFDTGNNAEIFAHNVQAKGIDLIKLDFVVVSHRHGDHTSGLNYLVTVNPGVTDLCAQENFGVFGAALPGTFYKRDEQNWLFSAASRVRVFYGKKRWPRGEIGTPPLTVNHIIGISSLRGGREPLVLAS